MRRLIGLMLLMLLLPLLVSAQDARESWDNLKRLQPGQKIEVVNTDVKSVKGTFVSYGEDEVSLQTDKGPLTIDRASVMRVSLREHSKRARNALIGAAIGAASGLAIGEVGTRRAQPIAEFRGEYRAMSLLLIPIGAGAGAGLGAAVPSYETVYRAPKREVASAR